MFMSKTQDSIDDMKDSGYKELGCVFNKLLRYHMKILLGDFNANWARKTLLNYNLE
jgi:hypothetical protein